MLDDFGDIRGLSQELLVMEEVIARQTPEAQSISRAFPAPIAAKDRGIAQLEARVAERDARLNENPCNSSLPPGAVHPPAKPVPPKK